MKRLVLILIMFSFFSKGYADYSKLAYDFKFNSIDGGQINLDNYREKVIVIVNVASRCGFTNQYEDLQDIWSNYKEKDLVVVGIPTNNFRQEPGSNKEIKDFCETNFNITFPIMSKYDVKGENAHPIYKWAKQNFGSPAVPKWNFHKILINKDGKIIDTFSSLTKPLSNKIIAKIEKHL